MATLTRSLGFSVIRQQIFLGCRPRQQQKRLESSFSPSPVGSHAEKLRFRIAHHSMYPEILDLMFKFFAPYEPMTRAMDLTKNGTVRDKDLEDYIVSSLDENLSVVAIDKQSNRPVGIQINGIVEKETYLKTPLKDVMEEMKGRDFRHIVAVMHKVNEMAKPNIFDEFQVDALFYLKMVTTDVSMRKTGLMKEMVHRSLDMAKALGIQGVISEATGDYSKAGLIKKGFEVKAQLNYEDYDENGENPFAHMKEPHKSTYLMARRL